MTPIFYDPTYAYSAHVDEKGKIFLKETATQIIDRFYTLEETQELLTQAQNDLTAAQLRYNQALANTVD